MRNVTKVRKVFLKCATVLNQWERGLVVIVKPQTTNAGSESPNETWRKTAWAWSLFKGRQMGWCWVMGSVAAWKPTG